MPRVSNIELLCQSGQPVLFIRTRTRVENLPQLIGESYGRMAAYLKELGEILADVPYTAYHNMDMQDLDVEIGFPLSKALPGRDDIQAGSIPGGKVIFCMYRGAYSEIGPVYEEMMKWVQDNGFTSSGSSYEYYYNGPGFPESEMLTRVVLPIA